MVESTIVLRVPTSVGKVAGSNPVVPTNFFRMVEGRKALHTCRHYVGVSVDPNQEC
jgi:hypothetical protein